MVHRYNVHFEYDKDIEISVIVETQETDELVIAKEAIKKLDNSGLHMVTAFEREYTIDLLETIESR